MGIAGLGCPSLFVFVDESAPTFQRVVTDLSVEDRLVSRRALGSVTPSSYLTPSKVLSTGKSPYAFWVGYVRTAPHQHG